MNTTLQSKLIFSLVLYCFNFSNGMAQVNKEAEFLSPGGIKKLKEGALEKTRSLENYIITITNKQLTSDVRINSVDLAVKLFISQEKIVEVSSKNREKIETYTIRKYLNRIRVLGYDKVSIRWYDIHYVSEFKQGIDGKFYAVVTIFQKFSGYQGENIIYEDITQKNIEIVVEKIIRRIGDKEIAEWEVLLGDISVVETK